MLQTSLVVVALALSVAGCGGSSKTESSATTAASKPAQTTAAQTTTATTSGQEVKPQSGKPLSTAVWIAKGDAICARANIHRHAQTAKTTQELARLAPQISGYDHIAAVELSKLVPPTAKTSDWNVIVTDAQKLSEFAARVGGYAQVNKFREAEPLMIAAANLQQQLTSIAQRDGFKKCSTQ
jgi:hypothetical protein